MACRRVARAGWLADESLQMMDLLRVAVGLTALSLIGVGCVGGLAVGEDAPDFQVTDIRGRSVRLSELKGRVVLVNFWGTWCGPCRMEAPELVRLHERLGGQPFELVAIAVGDERDAVARFAREKRMAFPVALDTGQSLSYRVHAVPTSVLVDSQGRVAQVMRGYAPEVIDELEGTIKRLIDSAGSAS